MQVLVEEIAAAISINQINYAVMMITPDDIDDFIVGFLFNEQIIQHNYDIQDIETSENALGLEINVTLANRCLSQFKHRQRQLKGATGCGVCGASALEYAFPKLNPLKQHNPYTIQNPQHLKQSLAHYQLKGRQTGAIHGAFWLDQNNQILACREDIGRHNALDKLIGFIVQKPQSRSKSSAELSQNLAQTALLITSRCSAELIQKAVCIGIPTLISLASPSQLAVKLAQQYRLNLVHIPRQDQPIVYPATTQTNTVQNNLLTNAE
ncbi:formate dehydrogenase accessory sulfurtransferase FdhD [Catenovulum sp. 2E275]|uniref:formate dehydrogenase accessory sulfurtransferase FdhD n=1 Tax=Catenovulum sp. 2E275 TaxID=2980497 RepID=UPI0021CF3A67|nr:formate dehydrogenase accessory sulfurtransferase FdhD [Catenovulum sp. 2E275]MCU4675992.1 formate dehydrogenase accessory sulfurtransferase FdhD [Catenovulum sp. 2E275]